jgi:hypothetical protein
VVQDALEGDFQNGLGRDGELIVKGEGGLLLLGVVLEVGGRLGLSALVVLDGEGSLGELELERVESDRLGRFYELTVNSGDFVSG